MDGGERQHAEPAECQHQEAGGWNNKPNGSARQTIGKLPRRQLLRRAGTIAFREGELRPAEFALLDATVSILYTEPFLQASLKETGDIRAQEGAGEAVKKITVTRKKIGGWGMLITRHTLLT